MDLISRQAAIEHLKKRLYETALNNVTEHPYYEEMADNMVSVWLKEVPSVQSEHTETHSCDYQRTETHGWIPLSEMTPEPDERVAVTTGGYEYHVWDCMSNREDDYFWEDEEGYYHNKYAVVAWMPLPEPYKEGQND